MSSRHRAGALIAALALTGSLAACGSDDDSSDTTAAPATTAAAAAATTAASSAGGGTEAFCNAVFEAQNAVNAGDDPAAIGAALATVESAAPAELAADAKTMVDAAGSAGEDGPPPEFYTSYTKVAGWMSDNCGVPTIAVAATEYKFTGFPATTAAGKVVISFANDGKEQHEMALVRINDGVTESVQDLLMLPEEEADTKITFISGMFAEPGQSSATAAELTPGRYAAVCFIPVGSTPEAAAAATANSSEVEGQPHAMVGMTSEFTVT